MSSLEAIFECTTDAVFGTDKHMRVRFWNRFCEDLFNIKRNKAMGRACYELICGQDLLGKKFCGSDCTIAKHHDRTLPNRHWDLVVRKTGGEDVVVNIGSYYTNAGDKEETGVRVFHSLRVVSCHQFIRRLTLNPGISTIDGDNISRLSRREYEVLRLVSSGVKARSIADRLGISLTTVRNHIKNIYSKLGVHSQAEAINCAMRHGLV